MKPPRNPIQHNHRRLQARRHNPAQSLARLNRDFARIVLRAEQFATGQRLRVAVWILAQRRFIAAQHVRGLSPKLDRARDEAERDFADGIVDAQQDAGYGVRGVAAGGGVLGYADHVG